ncbi:MAG: signal peptide peptidase SppA [Anaerolineae bacterium]
MSETNQETSIVSTKTPGKNRTALWVLISVVVGFMLPVCSCGVLALTSLVGIGMVSSSTTNSSGSSDAVAIVRVEGAITSSDSSDFTGTATSGLVISDLEAAANDNSVKAIVLRVDSPGGTVTGASQIYEVVRDFEKPVVVSMAGLAASGGYQISAPADYIFARPDTLTGSIGVIMTLYNAQELIDDIGVDVILITSGPNKSMGSTWEEITPEQQQIFEDLIDESYEAFVKIVADGRGMDMETVRQLADGRIYSGRQAVDNGLADELGNLDDAIAKAAELGGISGEPRIVEYDHFPGWRQLLLGASSLASQSEADRIVNLMGEFMTPALEYRYVGPQ